MKVLGEAKINLRNDKYAIDTVAIVSEDVSYNVLVSWHDLQRLGVISSHFPACAVTSQANADKICREFPEVFRDDLPDKPMNVGRMRVHLKENSKPYSVSTPRQIPLRFQNEAEKTLESLIQSGVIDRVDKPTEWCSPAFFVQKPDGKRLRLVTDFTRLNKFVRRPVHPFPCVQQIVQDIPHGMKFFAKLDAIHGYFQLQLDEESADLTTFLLPSGRYRYLRAPMGLSSSSDEWCRHSDRAIEGLPWARKIVDDILIWAASLDELEERVRTVATRCKKLNIALSRKKLVMGASISFAGLIIDTQGIRPDPDRIEALRKFPQPKDTTGVRSFLGLANQLSGFVPDFAHMTNRLRGLTGKGAAFIWLPEHEQEFQEVKKLLTSSMVVTHFNPNLPVVVLTDASRLHGLGFAMGHIVDGHLKIVSCGSRALTPTQQRYATIELECLAVVFAVTKCSFYLRGADSFKVITDHKPLEGIFRKDLFELTNPRLQRMREKITEYCFEVTWTPGKTHYVADALSRAPLFDPQEDEDLAVDTARTCLTARGGDHLDRILDSIDSDYRQFKEDVTKGTCKSTYAHQTKAVRDRLSVDGDLVYLDAAKIVVPTRAIKVVLEDLHRTHSGVTKTFELAKSVYSWPGMLNDIKQVIQKCRTCSKFSASQQGNPRVTEPPSEYLGPPMSHIGLDLCDFGGHSYLIAVDQWSGYIMMRRLTTTSSAAVVKILTSWFNTLGWPRSIRSDGGPQFLGDFRGFCETNEIVHEMSAPYNPKSNGLAEAGVKAAKRILSKAKEEGKDPERLLYEYRNIPRAHGYSPAQLLFGRAQRMNLPLPAAACAPINFEKAAAAKDEEFKAVQAQHDRGKKHLTDLQVGSLVWMQDAKTGLWDKSGLVKAIRPDGLSYVIDMEGRDLIRSRKMIKLDTSADNQGVVNQTFQITPSSDQDLRNKAWVEPTLSPLRTSSTPSLQCSRNKPSFTRWERHLPSTGTGKSTNLHPETRLSQSSRQVLQPGSPLEPHALPLPLYCALSATAGGRGQPRQSTRSMAKSSNLSKLLQGWCIREQSPQQPQQSIGPEIQRQPPPQSPATCHPQSPAATGSGRQWAGAVHQCHPYRPTRPPVQMHMPTLHNMDRQGDTQCPTWTSWQPAGCQTAVHSSGKKSPGGQTTGHTGPPVSRSSRMSARTSSEKSGPPPAAGQCVTHLHNGASPGRRSSSPLRPELRSQGVEPEPGQRQPRSSSRIVKNDGPVRPFHSIDDYGSNGTCASKQKFSVPGSIWDMKFPF